MFGFPLIAPTAITHLDNNCNGESCIALLSPTVSRDLTVKSRTQIFIFLPGDIIELKRVFKLKSAENILRFARFKKDAGRSLLGIGGSLPKEITGFPYIDATHRELIRLNLSRKFTTMVNTSRAHSVEEAIILAAVGVQTIRTPYLKIEIRGNDLMTKNDDILKAVKLLISLNKQLKLIPLIGKGISREMLEDLLNKPQVIALRIEATKPGSNNGLGTPTDKEQVQRVIHWAREIRPDAQLIAECGIGKPEDAKEAMAMGFNAVLVNAAITQSIDPVATAVAFSNAVGGSTKVVALTSVNKRSVNNSLHVSKAMAASVLTPGGIDLNAKHLGLDVENENDNFKMKLNLAMIAEFKRGNFSGIVPIIIRITMITSPLTSLGME